MPREIILTAEKVQEERAILMAAMSAKKPVVMKKTTAAKTKSDNKKAFSYIFKCQLRFSGIL